MVKTSSKNFIFWIVTLFVVVVVTLSITFAFFMYSRVGNTNDTIQSGTIRMKYDNSNPGVDLTDVSPISDETALNDDDNSFSFNVEYDINGTAKITYGIYLENITDTLDDVKSGNFLSIPTSSIKVALEDVTNQNIIVNPIFYSSVEKNTFVENVGNLLYSRTVTGKKVDSYKVYMWIPDKDIENNDVTLDELYSKTFSFLVNVKAIGSVNE